MSSTYLNRYKNRYRRAVPVVWYKDFTLLIKILPPAFLLVASVIVLLVLSGSSPGESKPGNAAGADNTSSGHQLFVSTQPNGEESSSVPPESSPAAGEGDTISAWNLILVNDEHPLPDGYEPDQLTQVGPGQAQCDVRIKDELERMLTDAASAGCTVSIISHYRTVEKQTELYENKVDEVMEENPEMSRLEAEAKAAQTVTYPGKSEHHTGLAFDIACEGHYDLTARFAETPEFAWLQENCVNYGFVIRYEEGKTHLTGINYEPWHYRYVGVEHAKAMRSLNMCLEEYISYLTSESA